MKPKADVRWIAQTEREWKDLMVNPRARIVRTKADWLKLARSGDNPLKSCSPETVAEFTRSLKFNNGGLAGAYFGGVGRELSFFEFRSLFERFGLGLGLVADHEGYECKSRGTCSARGGHICTSNC